MSVYIYTLPKAGTYFLAELLSNMGLHNTGYHLSSPTSYLDTKRHSLDANAKAPGVAKTEKYFVPLVRNINKNDVLFGHFPLPRNQHIAPRHMKYLCAYRHPRKTLMSEFVDFRFRRDDIPWLSRKEIPDDTVAFERYLERHGTTSHLSIFQNIVVYHSIINHPLETPAERNRVFSLQFDTLLQTPGMVHDIAMFLGLDISKPEAEVIHRKTLDADTKTKAVSLDVDRAALWSTRAEELFARSGFPLAISYAQDQGMQVSEKAQFSAQDLEPASG